MKTKRYPDLPIEQEKLMYYWEKIGMLEKAIQEALPILEGYRDILGFGEVCVATRLAISHCVDALNKQYMPIPKIYEADND